MNLDDSSDKFDIWFSHSTFILVVMKYCRYLQVFKVFFLTLKSATSYSFRLSLFSFLQAILICVHVIPGQAQNYQLDTRSSVQLPGAIGMGDALVALPIQQSAFFYNPAHGADASFHLTIIGVRTSLSTNIGNQLRFFKKDLKPAIENGLDELSNDDLAALYDETLQIGRSYSFLHADVLAPSFGITAGPVGFGIGIFGTTHVQYNFPNAGGGLPLVNFAGIADGMVVVNAAFNLGSLGIDGLLAGITAKYTSRFATLKSKPLDAIANDEPFYLLHAKRTGMDLGFQYKLPILPYFPGSFNIGLALYDIAGSHFNFQHYSTIQGETSDTDIAIAIEDANSLLDVYPSFRLGVAYALSKVPLGLLDETGITLDYIGYNNPSINQAFFAHLRMGIQARLSVVTLRTGLNQGYPTIGAGLNLGFMDLDYVFYGREEGRLPGQLPSWHHVAQLRFGI